MVNDRETRDELGLGGIRDSIADQLFPGTSTIQTRLRYFLFIPWIYRSLEQQRTPARRMAAAAREQEMRLMDALVTADDTAGVFGREAGHALKRLAASVYWAGLGSWGLRRFEGSQETYFASVDQLAARRRTIKRRDDGEREHDLQTDSWHPDLPPAPLGFPDQATLSITHDEAELLQECISSRHRESLLALLAENAHKPIPDVDFAWLHPNLADFTPEQQTLLEHGRRFSNVMYGAAILYNLLLSRKAERDTLSAEHSERLANWSREIDLQELENWKLDDLWEVTFDKGHVITARTRKFVEAWVERLIATRSNVDGDRAAAQLIQRREVALKGGRARFVNRRALDQYGGSAGLVRLQYRWDRARTLLRDLHDGLRSDA